MTEPYVSLFRQKLEGEYQKFVDRMLKKDKMEIIQSSYKIESYDNIFWILWEKSWSMSEAQLKALLIFPGVLSYFFCRWLKEEDSMYEELEASVGENLDALTMDYLKEGKEITI